MRLEIVVALLVNVQFAQALRAQLNQPCNKDRDTLLAEDADGNDGAFLRCNGVGVGTIGFWERKMCPNKMNFDFANQICRTDRKRARHPNNRLNIAILNNSCSRGERCIGGTVCDLETMKCLCPYGTIAQLETLSCVRPSAGVGNGVLQPPPQFNNFKQNTVNTPNPTNLAQPGFLPHPSSVSIPQGFFRPNPTPNLPVSPQIVLPPRPTSTFSQTSRPVPQLVPPGSSCRDGQLCSGGSVCTRPMDVCLCPGELEDHGGECVLPRTPYQAVTKVGIGALCNRFAECDHGSQCVNGRCQCVAPFIQHEGRCLLRQQQKLVGPGELCDNGEVCTKGSVCDTVIPVCICPPETDLDNGVCTPIQRVTTQTPPASKFTYPPPAPAPASLPTAPPPPPPPPPTMPPAPSTYSYSAIPTAPAPQPVPSPATIKPNPIKLGGSKQAGVGVRCSLNTDCMIGAYCNGNTNPPTCRCLSTHVDVDGRCEKVYYPGQTGCIADSQCRAAHPGTACIDRVCVCPEGSHAVDQTCVSDLAYPGDACDERSGHVPLCSGNAICYKGLCQCPPPLINFMRQCVDPSKLLLPIGSIFVCKSHVQCPPTLICLNGVCQCPPGQVRINSVCTNGDIERLTRHKRQSEDSMVCWPGSQTCAAGRGVCINDVCHCTGGFVQKSGDCMPELLPLNAYCNAQVETPKCGPDAACVAGVCTCIKDDGCAVPPLPDSFIPRSSLEGEEACADDDSCAGGLKCVRGRCTCDSGAEPKNGICGEEETVGAFKSVGSSCTDADRCSGGSTCIAGLCKCGDGSNESHGRCLQTPGGRCSRGQQCIDGAACEMGVCQCPAGTRQEGTRCLSSVAEPGKSCQLGEKCAHGSLCRFGICMCQPKYYAVGGRCVRKVDLILETTKKSLTTTTTTPEPPKEMRLSILPGSVCDADDVCTGNSKCKEGFCVCEEGELLINDICVSSEEQADHVIDQMPLAAPGQSCDAKTHCTGGSVCIENACTCPDPSTLNSGECFPSPEAGEMIKKSKEDLVPGSVCKLTIECPYRTECIRGVCRCKKGETIVNDMCRAAIYEVQPGGRCDVKRGYDCVGESHCYYGVCLCTRHLVNIGTECAPSSDLEKAAPGQSCTSDTNCTGRSRCMDGLCRCKDNEVVDVNKKCVARNSVYPVYTKTTKVTNAVTNKNGEGARRPANVSAGSTGSDDIPNAVTLPTLGQECTDDCRDSASCVRGFCRCIGQFIAQNDRCVHKADNDEVFMTNIGQLEETLEGTRLPNEVADVPLDALQGHFCQNHQACPQYASCINGICRCDPGFRASTGGYCLQAVAIGETCIADGQCDVGASCIDFVCTCGPGRRAEGSRCTPAQLARPGDDCTHGQVCSYNSYCGAMSGVCECPSGMATTQGRCEQTTASAGIACVTSRNCHKYSYCDNGYCLCKSGYTLVNNFCIPPPEPISSNHINYQLANQPPSSESLNPLPNPSSTYPLGFPGVRLPPNRNEGPNPPIYEGAGISTFKGAINYGPLPPDGSLTTRPISQFTGGYGSSLNANNYANNNNYGYTANNNNYGYASSGGQNAYGNGAGPQSMQEVFDRLRPFLTPNRPTQQQVNFVPAPNLQDSNVPKPVVMMLPNPVAVSQAVNGNGNFASPPNLNGRPEFSIRPGPIGPFGRSFSQRGTNQERTIDTSNLPLTQSNTNFGIGAVPYILQGYQGTMPTMPTPTAPTGFNGINSGTPRFGMPFNGGMDFVGMSQPILPFARGANTVSTEWTAKTTDGSTVKVAMPGEYCSDTGCMCLGNSVCHMQFCRCPRGSFAENGVCTVRKLKTRASASVRNAQPKSGLSDSTHEVEEATEARQFANPLESCQNDEFCMNGSECLQAVDLGMICQCPMKKLLLDGECVDAPKNKRAVGIGDSCLHGEMCLGGSECVQGLCVCRDEKVERLGICVVVAHPGDSCLAGELCIDGSVCESTARTCLCPTGKRARSGRCMEIEVVDAGIMASSAKPGEHCDLTTMCTDNSYCSVLEICECKPDYENIDARCIPMMKVRKPGSQCSMETVCSGGAACLGGICDCPGTTVAVDGQCVDVPRTRVARKQANKPKEKKSKEDPCEKDAECPKNTLCLDGLCVCPPEFTVVNNSCIQGRKLQESCDEEHLCMGLGEIRCTQGVCCLEGQTAVDGLCQWPLADRSPGTSCENDFQCKAGSKCRDIFFGYCVCREPWMLPDNEGNCQEALGRPVGSSCAAALHCADGLFCVDGRCRCDPEAADCDPVMTKVSSPPGGSCQKTDECTGGSVCREGWCICPDPTMIVTRGICVQSTVRPTVPPPPQTPPPPTVYQTAPPLQTYRPPQPPTAAPQPPPPIYSPEPRTETAPAPSYQSLPSPSAPAQSIRPTYNNIYTTRLPTSPAAGGRKAAPGTNCGPLDVCVGGSMCVEGLCLCPAGSRPSTNGRCEAVTASPQTGDYEEDEERIIITTRRPPPPRPPPSSQRPYRPPSPPSPPSPPPRPPPPPPPAPTRRPAPTIHIPQTLTHAPLTPTSMSTSYPSTNSVIDMSSSSGAQDECEAIGLFCRGNTVCRNRSCQCPDDYILLHDACVPPPAKKSGGSKKGKSWTQVSTTPRYAMPNEPCSSGETCTGGSVCSLQKVFDTYDVFTHIKVCACPPEKPIVRNFNCIASDEKPLLVQTSAAPGQSCNGETTCTEGSVCYEGLCRCQQGYMAISGRCIQTTPTTLATVIPSTRTTVYVGPQHSCGEGRECAGGSTCDESTGICMCPPGSYVYENKCIAAPITRPVETHVVETMSTRIPSTARITAPPETTIITSGTTRAECTDDTHCGEHRVCIVGRCKCRTGFLEQNGRCEALEDVIDYGDTAPISFSKHKVELLSPNEEAAETRATTKRPRIVGPPIRRPRPKTKSGGSDRGGGHGSPLKTGDGTGTCPPGNEPTREEGSGKIIICNGLEPNCPPRSYCYVTGFAAEEYNCCKSW